MILSALTAALLSAPAAHAAESAAYLSVTGALGFALHNVGDFALGSEIALGKQHGLVVEGGLIHVHGNPTHAWTYGGQLGYRYHLGGMTDAPFVGMMLGAKTGVGKVDKEEHGGPIWRVDLKHLSAVPHIGYRWGVGERLAITARLGAGYGAWWLTPRAGDEDIPDETVQLLQDRLQFSPVRVDSELSVGVRF